MTSDEKREANNLRKREQRQRERDSGIRVIECKVSLTEFDRLEELRQVRAGSKKPYDVGEYVELLIDRDWKRWKAQKEELESRICKKCGESLPTGCGGLFEGDSECFHTWPNMKEIHL